MTDIALPDPQAYTLALLPEFLEQSAVVRAWCEKKKDLKTANELKRRLDAFAHYLADKEAREQLKAERVLVEELIGKLIGPAVMGRNQYSGGLHDASPDPDLDLVVDASSIPPREQHYFRTLAANEELVKQLVSEGVTSRAAILRKISGKPASNGPIPLQDGEFRCPHCKRPVTLESLLSE